MIKRNDRFLIKLQPTDDESCNLLIGWLIDWLIDQSATLMTHNYQLPSPVAVFSLSLRSAGIGDNSWPVFFKTTYIVLVNLQEVAGGKNRLLLLLEAVNFTRYRLIRRPLLIAQSDAHYFSIVLGKKFLSKSGEWKTVSLQMNKSPLLQGWWVWR